MELVSESSMLNHNVFQEAASCLSAGIINIFEPPLKESRKQLKELEEKQEELIIKLHSENLGISVIQHSNDLQQMFLKMKLYHNKLQSFKKNIKILHERSVKLKKRALKLQHLKEQEPVEEIITSKPSSSVIRSTSSS